MTSEFWFSGSFERPAFLHRQVDLILRMPKSFCSQIWEFPMGFCAPSCHLASLSCPWHRLLWGDLYMEAHLVP